MISHKHLPKIVVALMAVAVGGCLAAMLLANQGVLTANGAGVELEYTSALFDTGEVLCVNIVMDEADWTDMLAKATEEQYYPCDVEVNGKMFYRVGIRPKGNTSLTSIFNDPTTQRYSFKLEFDQYVDGQTCFGLDKLILNNSYADATNMKETLIYDMYQYLGADASLYNYAKLSVNGAYWGLYTAVEAVEDSFLLRNYGVSSGKLYKPDSMNLGDAVPAGFADNANSVESFSPPQLGGAGFGEPDFQPSSGAPSVGSSESGGADAPSAPGMPAPEGGNFDSSSVGGLFGKFSASGGADLNYTDDDLDSYSTIWEGEITSTGKADRRRAVTALKNISQGVDLEKYMDIDNLLRYMAVHVFSVNEDSLSGMMAHNYYLYEKDGQLNLLPWDYNLALGGMAGGATDVVNSAIDDAFSGTNFFDSMMEQEEYHQKYYEYLQKLVTDYIFGEGFEAFYSRTREAIDDLVKDDPTAFYDYDEYVAAAETLYEVVKLRGKSIEGQLNGTIPSTESGQRNSSARIDASHIDLNTMGSMDTGGGGPTPGNLPKGQESFVPQNTGEENSGVTLPPQPDGEGTEFGAFQPDAQPPESTFPSAPSEVQQSEASAGQPETGAFPTPESGANFPNFPGFAGTDSGQPPFDGTSLRGRAVGKDSPDTRNALVTYGIYLGIMLVALAFAKLYSRKPRRR